MGWAKVFEILRHSWALSLGVFALLTRITLFKKGVVGTNFGYIDGYAITQTIISGLTAAVLLFQSALGSVLLIITRSPAKWLFFYYGICTLSAFWSVMPLYTLFRGVEVFSQFLAVFIVFFACKHFVCAEKLFLGASATALVLEVFGVILRRGEVSMEILHTCSYSNVGLVIFLYCLAELFWADSRRRRTLTFFLVLGLSAIVVGTSAATNLSAAGGCAIAIAISLRSAKAKLFTLVLAGILFALVMTGIADGERVRATLMPNKSQTDIETFTGRTRLWADLWGKVQERPILGYGFVASTRTPGSRTFNAHNALIQSALDTGLVGFCCFLLAILALAVNGFWMLRSRAPGVFGFCAAFSALIPVNLSAPFIGVQWQGTGFAFACLLGLYTIHTLRSSRLGPGMRAGGIPL